MLQLPQIHGFSHFCFSWTASKTLLNLSSSQTLNTAMLNPQEIYQNLQPKLEKLDGERIKLYKKIEPAKYLFWIIFTTGGTYVVGILNFNKLKGLAGDEANIPYLVTSYLLLVLLSLLYLVIAYRVNFARYKKIFNHDIAPEIVKGFGRKFLFSHTRTPSMDDLQQSLLGTTSDTDFACQVLGKTKKSSFQFAKIKSLNKSKKSTQEVGLQSFDGIYFRADFAVPFPTELWIIPKAASDLKINDTSISTEKVQMDRFRFHATETNVAMSMLQPKVMECLSSAHETLRKLKFTDGVIYHYCGKTLELAIATKSTFMQPRLGQSIDTLGFIELQTRMINAPLMVLEELTLS